MSDSILRDFALDAKATSVLITLQSNFITNDILSAKNDEKRNKKNTWHGSWKSLVNEGFTELKTKYPEHEIPRFHNISGTFRETEDYNQVLAEVRNNRVQAGLILLELVAFRPYFSFSKDDTEGIKGISVDKETRKLFLEQASQRLGFSADRAEALNKSIENTTNSMTGKRAKMLIGVLIGTAVMALTAGIAAPYIAGLYGASVLGLSGAAAVNAGLAALGGGAVAAGGLGMAGGTAILVGGGALLGFGTGAVGGHIYSNMTSGGALLQSVKLEVALKEFVLQGQYDTAKAQEVLFQQRHLIEKLEKEIDELRINGQTDEKRLKDLEKAVDVLRNGLKRNQDIVRDAA